MRQQAACEGNGSEGARAAHRCLLSIHRHLVWRAAGPLAGVPKPPQRGRQWRPRPALHCETQTRWSVRTCINALCRAHHQAEWLLFLDFNGGGWWLAGAGCASCYNQQQLRHSGFLQTFRRRRHARKVRQSRAGSSHRAGQGSDVRADTRLAAACTLPVPPADI